MQNEKLFLIDNVSSIYSKKFEDENINQINLKNKFGKVEIDLTKFNYLEKDFILNITNTSGWTNVLIGQNIGIEIQSQQTTVATSELPASIKDPEYVIMLNLKNKFGGVAINRR